ncbi:MAG: hypothetical protein ACE5JB_06570 [bacterium]
MTNDLDQEYWRKWGEDIDKALKDIDEFGRTRCRVCGYYKFTNDIAVCMDCSFSVPQKMS